MRKLNENAHDVCIYICLLELSGGTRQPVKSTNNVLIIIVITLTYAVIILCYFESDKKCNIEALYNYMNKLYE